MKKKKLFMKFGSQTDLVIQGFFSKKHKITMQSNYTRERERERERESEREREREGHMLTRKQFFEHTLKIECLPVPSRAPCSPELPLLPDLVDEEVSLV